MGARLGDDVEKQLEKVLKFEGVFSALKQIKDPIGAAAEAVQKELEAMRKIFDEAGLNVVDSVIAKDYPDDDAAAECMRLGALLA